jgi:hypothetical protein
MHVDGGTYLLSVALSWKVCETRWQLKMDGEARFKGARKTKRIGGWTKIRRGIRRRKRQVTKQKKVRFFWCEEGACRIDSCCVFFCCASSYVMASSVFCLELGLIKG